MHWDGPIENNLSNMIIIFLCGQHIDGKNSYKTSPRKKKYGNMKGKENETCINPKTKKISTIERFRLVLSG